MRVQGRPAFVFDDENEILGDHFRENAILMMGRGLSA
jgi:hypothetical protein